MSESFDGSRSLNDLEGVASGEPELDTFLVTRCTALRKKPIGELSVEELRIMIGQEIGLPVLVPLALETLETNPLAEGDYYPGDLLSSVLRAPTRFWGQRPDLRTRVSQVLARLDAIPNEVAEAVECFSQKAF